MLRAVTPLLCEYRHWFSNAQSSDATALRIVANVTLFAELIFLENSILAIVSLNRLSVGCGTTLVNPAVNLNCISIYFVLI